MNTIFFYVREYHLKTRRVNQVVAPQELLNSARYRVPERLGRDHPDGREHRPVDGGEQRAHAALPLVRQCREHHHLAEFRLVLLLVLGFA